MKRQRPPPNRWLGLQPLLPVGLPAAAVFVNGVAGSPCERPLPAAVPPGSSAVVNHTRARLSPVEAMAFGASMKSARNRHDPPRDDQRRDCSHVDEFGSNAGDDGGNSRHSAASAPVPARSRLSSARPRSVWSTGMGPRFSTFVRS